MYVAISKIALLSLISATFVCASSKDKYAYLKDVRCGGALLPTPTYGAGGVWMICTEELIKAPVHKVYNAIIDFPKYSIWNTFVINATFPTNPEVKGPKDIKVGLRMLLTTQGLIPNVETQSNETITVLEPGNGKKGCWAINAWRADDPYEGVLVKGEHPNVLTDVGGGYTRYVSWETYYSPSAEALLFLQPNLQKEWVQQGKDLKAYVERMGK